jgi:hypothetical protein
MSRKHLPAAVPVSIGCSVRIKYRFGGYGPLLINHLSPQAEFSPGSVRGFFRAFTSCCVTRTFPIRSYSISAKHFSCGIAHVSKGVVMRAHRTFLGFAIVMGCGITLQSTAFSQEYRGTWEQQMACTPDVWRLCGAQVPDVDRIVACLRRNTPQLSDRCRAVFEQGDNAPRRGEDRDYGQRRYDRDYGPRRYDRDYGPRRYDDDDE